MKRKFLSVLLSIILVIVAIAPAFTIANAEVWSGASTVPAISGGVYQIATPENLAWFSSAVNNGNSSIKAVLTADIQLNSANSFQHKWNPIGTQSNPFSGTFDGNGYTISGVCVEGENIGVGFFGYTVYSESEELPEDVSPEYIAGTQNYNIKNIKIVNSSISGKQNVGGLVGYASNTGILNCSFSGTVTGTENSVGGIVGWACSSSVVSESFTTGTVYGHQRTGGIVGYASGNAVITKCYSNAAVFGYMNVGGLVGTLSSASTIGAFFIGSVSAKDRAGGLVGYSAFGTLKSAYAVSTVTNTGTDTTDFGGAVGVTYGGTYASLFYSYETSGVDGPEGLGRTISELKDNDFVKEVNRSSPFFCFDYTNLNDGYPVLTWMLQLDVWAGDRSMPQRNASGTYLISKPSELAWFAALVNGTLSGFQQNTAANATVTDDLLFNIDVYDDSMGINEWIPIGTASSPYTGTFNGGGYNIAGLYTNPQTAGTNGQNVGLFGYISGGSVTATVVVGSLICGRENVGGIVGYMLGGTVSNSLCGSEVQGDRAVGGIAGSINSAASITNSGMTGTITGTNVSGETGSLQNIGGVVGYNNRSSVTKCFASTHINAPLTRWAGGIIGNNSNGTVTSCYSTSTVTGSVNAGGIAGYYNGGTIQKCYTAGKVTSTNSGIAFGMMNGSGVSYCYYDSNFKSAGNNVAGATEKTSTQMTGSYSTSSMYLGGDFTAKADDTYFYYYPQISSLTYTLVTALKNASLESVKRVQGKFIARVEIDGRTDTYYETLPEAFAYAASTPSSVLPTVFLVRDYTLTQPLTISSPVSFFGENEAVLSRDSSFTGEMINITGDVTIGSSLYGDDDEPQFFINGANIPGTQTGIVVSSTGKLTVHEGVVFENFRTANTNVRGAVVRINNGSFDMHGGKFTANESKSVGGAVYGENARIAVSGGIFAGNESKTQGGAIYNNNGEAVITGGTFTENIASTYGGAIAGYGIYSVTTVAGDALITLNEATYGGALSVQNYGTLEIDGGKITDNLGYSQGGAIYIENGSETIITGGVISDNIAENITTTAYGNGIYCDGDLTLKGAAKIDSNNNVYLPDGKVITISDRLTCAGYAATVTPASYSEGKKILAGSYMSSFYTKIGIANTSWHLLASGKLTNRAATNVAMLSKNHSYSVSYITLADAFAAVEDGDTAIITVVADNTVTEVIPVHGDVTLTCDDTTFTTMRGGSFTGVMFDVQPGATLRFGDISSNSYQTAQSDYNSGTVTAGQMVIDGGHALTGVSGAAAVNVQQGGTFYLYDDAIIKNCSNPTTSTVTLSGKMIMLGGTICNNECGYGGAVYVTSSGELNLDGGVIANNKSAHQGDAVYALGKVIKNIHSYNYYYIRMYQDSVTGETVTEDPVYKVTKKTDVLIPEGEAVFVNSNLIYVGETESNEYTRYLEAIPTDTSFELRNLTFDLNTYKVGNIALTGTNVINYYTKFIPYVTGYCVLNNGALGLNKLVPKANSGLRIDRDKNLISGIVIGANTVTEISGKFANDRTLVRFYNEKGTVMRTVNTLKTGCQIRLVDASGTVIDTVTVVVYGDINSDNVIDASDAVLVRAMAGGMLNSSNTIAARLEAADVNFDGNITAIDAESVEACGVFAQTIDQTR